jgi:hypothetical protein
VRLSHAVEVAIADGSGHQEHVRDAIRRHAASLKVDKPSRDYQLLDLAASRQVLAVSDRLWTEGTGSRTPVGALGTFWDDEKKSAAPSLSIDDLLED